MELENELKMNAHQGASVVLQTLTGKRPMTDLSKLGSASITQYTKFLATKGANNTVKYAAMRDISKDREELKKLIQEHGEEILPIKKIK